MKRERGSEGKNKQRRRDIGFLSIQFLYFEREKENKWFRD